MGVLMGCKGVMGEGVHLLSWERGYSFVKFYIDI